MPIWVDPADVLRQAYACANSRVIIRETIELYNPGYGGHIYLVNDSDQFGAYLEDESPVTYAPMAFKLTLPRVDPEGIQELSIEVDNVDQTIAQYIKAVKALSTPTVIKYRPYIPYTQLFELGAPPTPMPAMNPALTMYMTDSSVNLFNVKVRAAFLNYLNQKFPRPSQYYSRRRFPSLGQ